MVTHIGRPPGEGHQKFMDGLCKLNHEFEANGIPKIEQVAIMAQRIGALIHGLPTDAGYTTADILSAVAANIEAGNKAKADHAKRLLV